MPPKCSGNAHGLMRGSCEFMARLCWAVRLRPGSHSCSLAKSHAKCCSDGAQTHTPPCVRAAPPSPSPPPRPPVTEAHGPAAPHSTTELTPLSPCPAFGVVSESKIVSASLLHCKLSTTSHCSSKEVKTPDPRLQGSSCPTHFLWVLFWATFLSSGTSCVYSLH